MDHPKFIESNQKEASISIQRVKVYNKAADGYFSFLARDSANVTVSKPGSLSG